MNKQNIGIESRNNQKRFYNNRYQQGYMSDFSHLYEACRLYTIREILMEMKSDRFMPKTILDYGCGEGRYINVLKELFSDSILYGTDISDVGLQIAHNNYPYAQYISMKDELIDIADETFDLIISIEVLEHVKNVEKTSREIVRLLKPGGIVIITTPCANKLSLEWCFNKLTNGLQKSSDGYGRFATDEPAHLRRLNDKQIRTLFSESNINIYKIYHRAHFFTTFIEWIKPFHYLPTALRVRIALLDWHLFKNFPNGATMVAVGKKEWTS